MNLGHEQRFIEKTIEEHEKGGEMIRMDMTHIEHKNFVVIQYLTISHVGRMQLLGNILQSADLIP